MHFYRPDPPYFVGDCMPFSHDGVFHLYYLLDENHHQGNHGLGGHQWAHASTTDLVHWQHHPLALPITAEWEASICTGSTYWHDGQFFAFYATRKPDQTQHLCLATSRDGINFEKSASNPFASPPPGYGRCDLRDPFVFRDAQAGFHLLATARLDPFPLDERGGCLLHYTSSDLHAWTPQEPFFIPGGPAGYASIPECPDYFEWNGWYYLLYSQRLETHYRFSRTPWGPWQRPVVDLLDSRLASVMKTAPFGDNRRIGVAFVGTRKDNQDSSPIQWAGNALFRELVQYADGTLGTRFVPEMQPEMQPCSPTFEALTAGVSSDTCGDQNSLAGKQAGCPSVTLDAPQGQSAAVLSPLPQNFRLRCTVIPNREHLPSAGRFGLGLRGSGAMRSFIELACEPSVGRVWLGEQSLDCAAGLEQPFTLEVRCQGDLVEVCLNQQRCLVNRLGQPEGERLFLFCEHGRVTFADIEIGAI